jgi:energy-coupling factor transporter ATP-binding protein EcfA2
MNQIYIELLPWFQQLPAWQNEIFRRLLKKPKLEEKDISEIYEIACDELGLTPTPKAIPQKLVAKELPVSTAAGTATGRLIAVHSTAHVNMLASGHRLQFGPRLTIVYGNNGSGKSGYARILKKACRCNEHAIEKVLPNVYDTSVAGDPSATIEIEENGVTRTIIWKESTGSDPALLKYAVFDSKAARSYLGERNILPLVPNVFVKLAFLGDAVLQIKEKLLNEAAREKPVATVLSGYVDLSKFGEAIAGINSTTQREKLESALVWTDTDQAALEDQESQLTTLKSKGPEALRRELLHRKSRLTTLIGKLKFVEDTISESIIAEIKKVSILCKTLDEEKRAAAKLALGESEIAGIGSGAWESLIRSAEKFFKETYPDGHFPGISGGAICVLCQQPLSPSAHEKLQQFWKFIQDDAAQKHAKEEKKLSTLLLPLKVVTAEIPAEIEVLKEQLSEEFPTIWKQVPSFFAAASLFKDLILSAVASGDWAPIGKGPVALSPQCEAEVTSLIQKEKDLGDAAIVAKELKDRSDKIADFHCRKKASAGRENILAYHEKLVKSQALLDAANRISTQGISTKSSALQKKHVIEEFAKQVKANARELGLLRAVPEISSRAKEAQVSQKVGIHGAKADVALELVFSEGERTALALAYFLAELGTTDATKGIIFDDPVTSLDHEIRTQVARKITEIASVRQVIVFTHDLPFFCELKEIATRTKVECELCSIESLGKHVGQVRSGEPWDAMRVTAREEVLGELVKEGELAESEGNNAKYEAICQRFYSKLRSTWERAVEEFVFNKVVLRYDKAVKTQSLRGVVVDATIIAEVFTAMSKCSGYTDAHDGATAANKTLPPLSEMRADLSTLQTFCVNQKKKINAQEKTLSHLK